MADEAPKLQIDSDWKKQAQQEKERLTAEVERKPAASAKPGIPTSRDSGEQPQAAVGPEGLPVPSFQEIVETLGMQALTFLGQVADPATGRAVVSLPLAKHFIDVLGVLEDKTRGNLSADEKKHLDQMLYEARMIYVQLASGGVGAQRQPRPSPP